MICEYNDVNNILSNNQTISADMLNNFDLSDKFIENTFEINVLKQYFDMLAWEKVLNLYNDKIEKSTYYYCKFCIKLCLNNCICCNACNFWFHWKCANVSHYHSSGKSKNWYCRECKLNKN